MFDPSPSPSETRDHLCPYCDSAAIVALGRILAARTEIKSEYRCRACRKEFVLLRHIGLTTAPRESPFPNDGALQ